MSAPQQFAEGFIFEEPFDSCDCRFVENVEEVTFDNLIDSFLKFFTLNDG